MRIWLLCSFALLAACASGVEKGLQAFNAGRYEDAYTRWSPSAARGDPVAQHNMGVLWQQGLSRETPKNLDRAAEFFLLAARQGFVQSMVPLADYQLNQNQRDAAISWLMLASRWNDQNAVLALSRLGVPVPPPDLAAAQQQANAVAALTLGAAVACAVSGNCGQATRSSVECRARTMKDLNGNLIYRCE